MTVCLILRGDWTQILEKLHRSRNNNIVPTPSIEVDVVIMLTLRGVAYVTVTAFLVNGLPEIDLVVAC